MQFDPEKLRAALDLIPTTAYAQPSQYSKTKVHHGYRQFTLVAVGVPQTPLASHFQFVFDELAPIYDAWLSWIPPGGFIVPHVDAGPYRERWQVPIVTGAQWVDSDVSVPTPGEAFRVSHWEPHAVANRSQHDRIHIVIDRDIVLDSSRHPFETYPVPEDMADMVRRSQ